MTIGPVGAGRPDPLGVTLDAAGVNVAVVSSRATAIAVSVFDDNDTETACLRLPGRTGDVFHGHIGGIGAGTRYGLRAFGPWDPAHGDRFNPAKLLLDPFAAAIDRPFRLHPALFDADAPHPDDTAALMPKAIVVPPPPPPQGSRFDWDRAVIYELHVRGFTMRHPEVPPAQRGTFAALAHPAVIGHLTRLGVTAVELMPSAAWVDERHLPPLGLGNYWGYNPVAFLAPDPRLAPGAWTEISAAVAALQAAGIAVLLDVVLNHTGEGDALGPTLSLRGLDNALYYRLAPDDAARYVNDTGCGNTLALDRPAVLHLAMAALRGWARRAGVDGFRVDLATTLGRRDTGFDPTAPLLAAIAQDPLLSRLAFIAEPWDVGPGGYQLGAFPAAWGEWNDRYRDTARRFWRGDGDMLGDLATRFAGSADVFAPRHRPLSRSVNFITAHDGFTLADLVSYATKHNAANGEANRDGTDANYAWNNGSEGPSDDLAVRAARARDLRALLATLLLSRGTPMLSMGDEVGRSQGGNNNAYAQDNGTTWLDWDGRDADLAAFTARLIAARQDCEALRGTQALTGQPVDESLIPDVAWHLPDGRALTPADWHCPDLHTLVAALYQPASRAAVVLHAGRQDVTVKLPASRAGQRWRCVVDTARPARTGPVADHMAVAARAVVLLVEEPAPGRPQGVSSDALDRLAREAGIAPSWWDIAGREHRVGDDTKRTLLAAMRLPADSAGALADSLHRLAGGGQAAALPPSLVVRMGEPIRLRLGPQVDCAWLALQREDGGVLRIPIAPDEARMVVLPAQPIGRHRVWLEDRSEQACNLAVVPARCHLPPALAAGQRRFGIAAQLYALRRPGEQGIGDFTTLRQLATAAAGQGAALIGLNPLHALFPTDRARASPYHPSHRQFLDPIYLDVTALPGAPAAAAAALSGAGGVDYPTVWVAKHRALQAAFETGGADDPALDEFIAAGGEALHHFACFETIADARDTAHWQRWPGELRHPASPGVAAFIAAHPRQWRFACYLQWLADRQLAAAAAAARQAGLAHGFYRDLAVGGAPDGAEAWARQDALLEGVSIGAPPDPFSAAGQVWSLPPPDPLAMAREGYAGFAALLAANMRHAGALRIDHVMGLQRLFLVPDGARAAEGAYLAYPFQDLLGHMALESTRAECLVVGEDLGTVPPGMRNALAAANVLSYRVLWFERDGEGFRPPASWPRLAAACVSTHDLPTLRGWWDCTDIAERDALGLLDAASAAAARAERARDKAQLLDLLRQQHLLDASADPAAPFSMALAVAVHALVARTPSLLALVQADDLADEAVAVNLPGTDRERPNWRRRLRQDVAALCTTELARNILAALRAAGRG